MDSNLTNLENLHKFVSHDPLLTTIVGGVVVIFVSSLFEEGRNFLKRIFMWFYALFSRKSYEIIDLRKHVTVCENGHLIILHDFRLKLYKNNANKFTRILDVSDGADSCKLKSLSLLLKTPKKKRFSQQGFWYKTNPSDVISKAKEEFETKQSNSKKLKFYFMFNKRKLKEINTNKIKLMYGFSIPHGQPLKEGYFDYDQILDKSREPVLISGFTVRYKMNKIHYVIGLLDGVKLNGEIKAYYYPDGTDHPKNLKEIKIEKKDDLYYQKYFLEINKPKENSSIVIKVPILPKERKT